MGGDSLGGLSDPLYFCIQWTDNGGDMANTTETTPLNFEAVDFDDDDAMDAFHEAWSETGQAKLQDDFRRLREMGIVDAQGRQLKTIVPADMLDDSADFGG